jgi:anti-sigma regulatory factor (Ser/Thr protein kinase)
MTGSTACTPRSPAGDARAARDGAGAAPGNVPAPRGPGPGDAQPPTPPRPPQGPSPADDWPLQDFIELGPLPGAVPCARLHTRLLLREWGLAALADGIELLVSELVTNAVKAARFAERITPVRLWLLADNTQVLILVWDASPETPVRVNSSEDTEGGRGLMLVQAISDKWSWYRPQETDGKVVWALTRRQLQGPDLPGHK